MVDMNSYGSLKSSSVWFLTERREYTATVLPGWAGDICLDAIAKVCHLKWNSTGKTKLKRNVPL